MLHPLCECNKHQIKNQQEKSHCQAKESGQGDKLFSFPEAVQQVENRAKYGRRENNDKKQDQRIHNNAQQITSFTKSINARSVIIIIQCKAMIVNIW